jgi:hypothetical protein
VTSYPLSNFTAPDAYLPPGQTATNSAGALTGPATLYNLPVVDHVNLDVLNAAIYWSIAQADPLDANRAGRWQSEVFMAPGSRVIQRAGIVGVRVRAARLANQLTAGALQAQVTVEAVEA